MWFSRRGRSRGTCRLAGDARRHARERTDHPEPYAITEVDKESGESANPFRRYPKIELSSEIRIKASLQGPEGDIGPEPDPWDDIFGMSSRGDA